MSLYSYISFPRPVDTSCLVSKFDKAKAFKVGDLRGTELEKQIDGGISSQLPDNVTVYLGDMTDLWGINIFDKHTESFDTVFNNKFIYRLEGDFDFGDTEKLIEQSMEIYHNSSEEENGGQTEEEFMEFSVKLANDKKCCATLCRQQLNDIVVLNAKPGESIEIYSIWTGNESSDTYGPPTEVKKITNEEVATTELLNLQENVKIEIIRTVWK